MPAAPGLGPGGERGRAWQGSRGPARAPEAVGWSEGGQRAVQGPRGASRLPQPRSRTPDAPGAATWPDGSGTTPGSSKRVLPAQSSGEGPVASAESLPAAVPCFLLAFRAVSRPHRITCVFSESLYQAPPVFPGLQSGSASLARGPSQALPQLGFPARLPPISPARRANF